VPKSLQVFSFCRSAGNSEEIRCYTDASIDSEVSLDFPKSAGLGILIQDSRRNGSYHIKLRINEITSVVMAEAAAIAFAAAIVSELGLEEICFYIDNQMLANSLNGEDCSWLPSTQTFTNYTNGKRIRVLKIPRARTP